MTNAPKDFLGIHLRDLPYFRAMLRAVEARFYQELPLAAPTLDLGCGDGDFAQIAFDRRLEVGLDPWTEPLQEARQRNVYQGLIQADAGKMPFPTGHFASAVSNSVLEHIPHLDEVIIETGRVLRPGAMFYFCVPNHFFNPNLFGVQFFEKLKMPGMTKKYMSFYDRIARHQHLDSPQVWQPRLEKAGFEIVRYWHYFSPDALHVLEWGHLFGLPSLVVKKLTGQWHLVKSDWNFALIRSIVQRYYDEAIPQPKGTCTFYVARKV